MGEDANRQQAEPGVGDTAAAADGLIHHRFGSLRTGALWSMVVLTGLIGLAGLYDLAKAQALGARLIGGLLAAIAVFVLWAVAGRRRDGAHPVWVPLAASLVMMVALFLLIRLLDGFAVQAHLIAVLAFVVTLGVIAAILTISGWHAYRPRPAARQAEGEGTAGHGQMLLAPVATVLGALVALPLTWYSAQYQPSIAQAVVSIQAELADAKRQKDSAGGEQMAVTARIKVVNTGRTSVRMIFSQYEIVGAPVSLAKTGGDQISTRVNLGEDGLDATSRYAGFADYGAVRLIQYGRVFWDQTTLEPDEESTLTVLAFYPPKTFALIRLGVDLVYARTDRVPVGAGEYGDGSCSGQRNGRVLLARWPIEPASLLERVTESEREVVTGRFVPSVPEDTVGTTPADAGRLLDDDSWGAWWPSLPAFDYQIQKRGDPCRNLKPGHSSADTDRGLERRSKLGESGALAELPSPMR